LYSSSSGRLIQVVKKQATEGGYLIVTPKSSWNSGERGATSWKIPVIFLKEKLLMGEVFLLILDPDGITSNFSIVTFLEDEEDRKDFHYEIRNSIRKLNQIRKSLPSDSFHV
jgi:hypothetical protein